MNTKTWNALQINATVEYVIILRLLLFIIVYFGL